MANIKISQLPAATSPVSPSDVMPVVQGGVTKKAAIDQLGFVASGSGAVTRTIQSKLRDVVSVKDFGAVGNGVDDDMNAFIAAVAAVKAAGGGTVFIPNTPNGYYLRRGAGCDLSGSDGISIVSNGATLKLQGGTFAQANSPAVFYASTAAGVQNLTIEGLRFESASTVLRYGNGPAFPTHFDDEVNLGRANALEQTSFRFAMNLQGASNNILIKDCYFGEHIFEGVKVTAGGYGTNVKTIQLQNLTFYKNNSQSIFLSTSEGIVISGINSFDHLGSKFDWTFYFAPALKNLVVSDVAIYNSTHTPDFGTSAIALDGSTVNATVSNVVIENIGINAFVVASENVTISNVTIKSCGASDRAALSIGLIGISANNVSITGLKLLDCLAGIGAEFGSNIQVSDFVIEGATSRAISRFGSGNFSGSFSNGRIVNCGSTGNSPVKMSNNSFVRKVEFSDVDFIYDTFVPDVEAIDIRGANTSVYLTNCRFRSEFGTSSKTPTYSDNGCTIIIDGCSETGYSVPMTRSAADGQYILPYIAEQPLYQHVLTANSATPSVAGKTIFVTANTLATSITNFTGGVQGQEIYVRVDDANTTFDFSGSSLKGNGGVDFTAASGDMLMATLIGSLWYCTIVEA